MTSLLKITGTVLGILLVCIIAGIIAFTVLVDPNDYKDEIARSVYEATGREVVFEGDIALSYFPWLGLETGAMRMINPDKFGGGEFVALRKAGLHVKVSKLLSGEVQISEIVLDGLSIYLVRNTDGSVNWELTPPSSATDSSTGEKSYGNSKQDTQREGSLPALLVNSIRITNANLRYLDKSNGADYRLNTLALSTSTIRPGNPVSVTLSGNAAVKTAAEAPQITAEFNMATEAMLATDLSRAALTDTTIKINGESELLPAGTITLTSLADISYDILQQQLHVERLSVTAYDAKLETQGNLLLKPTPSYTGILKVESALRKTLAAFGSMPETQGKDTLRNLDLSMEVSASQKEVSANAISGKLDETSLSGDFRIRRFMDQNVLPDIRFTLTADAINADNYMPPKTSDDKTVQTGDKTTGDEKPSTAGIPDEVKQQLRTLDLDGTVQIGTLTVSGIQLSELLVTAKAHDGLFRLDPFSARLFEGSIAGSATTDLRSKTLLSSLNTAIRDIQLGPLLESTSGKRHATGAATLITDMKFSGETPKQIMRTLTGKGNISVLDGAIYGFQIIPESAKQSLKESQLRSLNDVNKADDNTRRQKFDKLSASYSITNGLIRNGDLALVSPHLNAEGGGTVDLAGNSIDYKANIDVAGLAIPVSVTGSLTRPSYGFDAGRFLQDTVKSVRDLLPIPNLGNKTESSKQGDKQQNDTSSPPTNPIEELGKGLKNLFQ